MTRTKLLAACVILCLGGASPCCAQPLNPLRLAGSGVALGGPHWYSPSPATLPPDGLLVGLSRPFGLSELDTASLAVGNDGLLVGGQTLGFAGYRELALTVSASVPVGSYRAGLALSGTAGFPEGFSASHSLDGRLGLQRAISPELRLGLLVAARELALGAAWSVSSSVLTADLVQTPDAVALRVGWLFQPAPALRLEGGLSSNPSVATLGAVVGLGSVEFFLLMSLHDPLGWTQFWGVSWLY